MGIQSGYYSGAGATCVQERLNPTAQEMVAAFAGQACARARAINSFDPDDACKQARMEAQTAAWHALVNAAVDAPPPELSIDQLMPGFNERYGTPELPVSDK